MRLTDIAMASQPRIAASRRLLFTVAICAGSFLLFLVQPMIARMALPRLGGAPAVWNSAMLVYQALLLGGYAYAHWLGRFAPRTQSIVHLGGFAIAGLMLPIGLSAAVPPADASPFVWVPWLLLSSIGPLFFIVSAQAPLMQRWFALSGGDDPYPLYAASNLGSFAGLIAYPLIVEPLLPVQMQSLVWSGGYVLLALLVMICALRLPAAAAAETETKLSAPPAWRDMAKWAVLAAIPSGLMLATTLHLTTDIVAMPLLWVIPLGLYLLSFSVAFATGRRFADALARIAPLTLLVAACGVFVDASNFQYLFALASVANLFVAAVALHGRMYESRPAPEHLTRFYLAMSAGGVLGGLFCALIAPLVFDWTYEYPILMVAAAVALTPRSLFERTAALWAGPTAGRIARFGAIGVFLISLAGQGGYGIPASIELNTAATVLLCLIGVFAMGSRLLFAATLAALMLSASGWTKLALSAGEGLMTRSFFGVYSMRPSGPKARLLVHGTTVHGIQLLGSPARERMPNSYYAPESGVGLAMTTAPALFGSDARIGVVGLGAGTLACYARPGESWQFYEIDPAIERIARDPKQFTFLSRCQPGAKVSIGDARLVLAGEAPASADLLVVDAFSSDSVPMHLLTTEAFATYRRKIASDGLLLVHISNRFLDLSPVVAAAAAKGWTVRVRNYTPDEKAMLNERYSASIWVALSPSAETMEKLVSGSGRDKWNALPPRPGFSAWTDDHASILPILKLRRD